MALRTDYGTGTASVTADDTEVTGHGTLWQALGIAPGDLFCAAGLSVRIASIESNTALTLVQAWPGAALDEDGYEIRFTPDAARVLGATREVLEAVTSGNIARIEQAVEDAEAATQNALDAAGSLQDAIDAAEAAELDRIAAEAAKDDAVLAKGASEAARDLAEGYRDDAQGAATAPGLDRSAVAADKGTVAADKATVAADKLTVAADKATAVGAKDAAVLAQAAAEDAADVAESAASTASGHASTATTKAGEASASATSAGLAKTAAEEARDAADAARDVTSGARDDTLAAVEAYSKIWLGGKSEDPTTDNAGNPLTPGAAYYNSTTGKVMVYRGAGLWLSLDIDMTGAEILAALLAVDGAGSGLDADRLGGKSSAEFATSAQGGLADTAVQPDDLGSAAFAEASDFATSTQGGKADTAVQPDDLQDAIDAALGTAQRPTITVTANHAAVVGQIILCDTSAAAITVTLPGAPVSGNVITIARKGANNVVIARNGKTIAALAEDHTIDINKRGVELVYDGSTWWPFAHAVA